MSGSAPVAVSERPMPATRYLPRVAVVTVNYNGGAFLEAFLDSFSALTYPRRHLIVIDNASTDRSWQAVARRAPHATLIRAPENGGFTAGNNRAVRAALADGAEYIFLVNNDTRLDPGILEALLDEADQRTCVAPHVLLEGSDTLLDDTVGRFSWLRGAWRDWQYGRPAPESLQRPGPVEMASLTALLIPASVFREVGFLDERMFMYYEDFDFIRRAQRRGFRIRQTPAARLWHRRAASSGGGETAFKYYYATRNRFYLLQRHQPAPLFVAILPYLIVTRIVRATQLARNGRCDLARAIVSGMVDYARNRMGKTWRPPGES